MSIVLTPFARARLFPRDGRATAIRDCSAEEFERRLNDEPPLQVLPGTHRHGRLPAEQIADFARTIEPVACTAGAGDILLMRPLLLHASSPARSPQRRRVLHVELAAGELPGGLQWGLASSGRC